MLVTNSLTYVDKADIIVMLDNGRISEYGTFQELMANDGVFASLIREHMSNKAEHGEEDETGVEEGKDDLKKPEMGLIKPEAEKKSDEKDGRKLITEEVAQTGGVSHGHHLVVMKKSSQKSRSCHDDDLVITIIRRLSWYQVGRQRNPTAVMMPTLSSLAGQ